MRAGAGGGGGGGWRRAGVGRRSWAQCASVPDFDNRLVTVTYMSMLGVLPLEPSVRKAHEIALAKGVWDKSVFVKHLGDKSMRINGKPCKGLLEVSVVALPPGSAFRLFFESGFARAGAGAAGSIPQADAPAD